MSAPHAAGTVALTRCSAVAAPGGGDREKSHQSRDVRTRNTLEEN